MSIRNRKDIFMLHSESSKLESALFQAFHNLIDNGPQLLTAYEYTDWTWKTPQFDRSIKRYCRTGERKQQCKRQYCVANRMLHFAVGKRIWLSISGGHKMGRGIQTFQCDSKENGLNVTLSIDRKTPRPSGEGGIRTRGTGVTRTPV